MHERSISLVNLFACYYCLYLLVNFRLHNGSRNIRRILHCLLTHYLFFETIIHVWLCFCVYVRKVWKTVCVRLFLYTHSLRLCMCVYICIHTRFARVCAFGILCTHSLRSCACVCRMSFDERAERCIVQALKAGQATGFSTRGGNLRFPVHRSIVDKEIVAYCLCWMDPVNPSPGVEVGWRPRLELTDLTVIQMLSKDLLQCQGRVETVDALSPIAAALVCGIPPETAMRCPSTTPFWDWCEKHRIRTKIDRPPTALNIPSEASSGKKSMYGRYHDPSAVTSVSVCEYVHVVSFSDATRALIAEGVEQLEERDMRYLSPNSLEEANLLIEASMDKLLSTYDGSFYMFADLEHPHRITTGQLIAFCKRIWHDGELYHLATRWRPAYMPNAKSASKDYEKRGGIYLPDKYNVRVSIMGSPSICQGLAPILAAIRIRLDPEISKKTNLFGHFFEFMKWDVYRELNVKESCVSDVPPKLWSDRIDDGDRFAHEELQIGRALKVLMSSYNSSQGQYAGADCWPNVAWSRADFVDQLMRWWPHADIKQAPKFRYVPHFMEKGGLDLDDGGKYVGQQGKASAQGALMFMAASLVCGVPSEIAALLSVCDQFWSFICEIEGPESVLSNRARIRQIRDAKYTREWDRERASLSIEKGCGWSITDRNGMSEKGASDWAVDTPTCITQWGSNGGGTQWDTNNDKTQWDINTEDTRSRKWDNSDTGATKWAGNTHEATKWSTTAGNTQWGGNGEGSQWGNNGKATQWDTNKGSTQSGSNVKSSEWGIHGKATQWDTNIGNPQSGSNVKSSEWGRNVGSSQWDAHTGSGKGSQWDTNTGNTQPSSNEGNSLRGTNTGNTRWGSESNWGNSDVSAGTKMYEAREHVPAVNAPSTYMPQQHAPPAYRPLQHQPPTQASPTYILQPHAPSTYTQAPPMYIPPPHGAPTYTPPSPAGDSLSGIWEKLELDFEMSNCTWADCELAKPLLGWACVCAVFEFCLAVVGSLAPQWAFVQTGDHLTCTSGELVVHFIGFGEPLYFRTVGCSSPLMFPLIASICQTQPFSIKKNLCRPEFDQIVQYLSTTCIPKDANMNQVFSKRAISEKVCDSIEHVPPKTRVLISGLGDLCVGQVLKIEWESEEYLFGNGRWLKKSDVDAACTQ